MRQTGCASAGDGNRLFSLSARRRVLLLRVAESERRHQGLEPHDSPASRAFRDDRALFLFRHGAEYSACFGDDDSVSFADLYGDHRDFSA